MEVVNETWLMAYLRVIAQYHLILWPLPTGQRDLFQLWSIGRSAWVARTVRGSLAGMRSKSDQAVKEPWIRSWCKTVNRRNPQD